MWHLQILTHTHTKEEEKEEIFLNSESFSRDNKTQMRQK